MKIMKEGGEDEMGRRGWNGEMKEGEVGWGVRRKGEGGNKAEDWRRRGRKGEEVVVKIQRYVWEWEEVGRMEGGGRGK